MQLKRQEMKLCGLCKAITIEKMKQENGYAHHASWIDLKSSGNRGRQLCFIVYNISIIAAGSEKSLAASFDSIEDSYIRLVLSPVDRSVISLSCGESPWHGRLGLCINQGSASIASGRC